MMVGVGRLAERGVQMRRAGPVDRMEAGPAVRSAGYDREQHALSGFVRTRRLAELRVFLPAADDPTPIRGLVCALWVSGGSGRDLL